MEFFVIKYYSLEQIFGFSDKIYVLGIFCGICWFFVENL